MAKNQNETKNTNPPVRPEANRILVIDDRPEDLEQIREFLGENGYEVIQVPHCPETIEKIEDAKPDLLLIDVSACQSSEADACARLREKPETTSIPIIALTNSLKEEAEAAALRVGADDFVERPFDKGKLLARVVSLLRLSKMQQRLVERNDQLQAVNARLEQANKQLMARNREVEQGMEMAHRLQQALLPQQYPHIANILFCHKYTPADTIGGDFFQIIDLGEDRAALFVSDVAGHGMQAALVTASLKTLLDLVGWEDRSPGEILGDINRRFRGVLGHMAPQVFATAFVMIIDGKKRRISLANAGHPRPLLVRKDNMSVEPLLSIEETGPALGFLPDPPYATRERQLHKRDIALGFTDGIFEGRNSSNQLYGLNRLVRLVKQNAHLIPRDLIQRMISDTEDFMGSHKHPDDVCVVAVEVH